LLNNLLALHWLCDFRNNRRVLHRRLPFLREQRQQIVSDLFCSRRIINKKNSPQNLRTPIAPSSRANFGGGAGTDGPPRTVLSGAKQSNEQQTNHVAPDDLTLFDRLLVRKDKAARPNVVSRWPHLTQARGKPMAQATPSLSQPILTEISPAMAKRKQSKIIRKPVAPPANEW